MEQSTLGIGVAQKKQADQVIIGEYIFLNENVYQVVGIVKSKPGKVGTPKVMFMSRDIFTDRKIDLVEKQITKIVIPIVKKYELQIIDIGYDGQVCLLQEDNTIKEDNNIVKMVPMDEQLEANLKKDFLAGKEIMVEIIQAMSKERIISYREINCGSS